MGGCQRQQAEGRDRCDRQGGRGAPEQVADEHAGVRAAPRDGVDERDDKGVRGVRRETFHKVGLQGAVAL